jgi:nucleoside-triphosphatase THEP1
MCFFKKRKENDAALKENKRAIEAMTGSLETLKVATDNAEVLAKIEQVQEKIKYMNPTLNKAAHNFDKKIVDSIGDLKIAIMKIKTEEDVAKILNSFKHLEMLVADRLNNSRS